MKMGTSLGVRREYNITSNHLLCFSFLGSESILEVFPLPDGVSQPNDDEIPSVHILTRSHKCTLSHCIGYATSLTERHEILHNSNNHSTHYTLIAMGGAGAWDQVWGELGFLDISLESDLVAATCQWTDAVDSQEGFLMLASSSRAGLSRLVAFNRRAEAMALTVSEDGDGKRVVRAGHIVVDKKLVKLVMPLAGLGQFDGVQGRLCRLGGSKVEMINFV
jgi:hypothetical protein